MKGEEIRALSRLMNGMDYYRLLRVDKNAPSQKIRHAYHRARRQFHPDAHLSSEPDLRKSVDLVARRITEAYMTLRNPEQRAAYDEGLKRGELRYHAEIADAVRQESSAAAGRTPNGRRFFALALAEERAGNLSKAASHVKMALTFERNHAGFQGKLEELQSRLKTTR
jgi:DnaJ-class molecular chaperone